MVLSIKNAPFIVLIDKNIISSEIISRLRCWKKSVKMWRMLYPIAEAILCRQLYKQRFVIERANAWIDSFKALNHTI